MVCVAGLNLPTADGVCCCLPFFSNQEGIRIRLQDSDKRFDLPPDPRGIRVAKPGTYRLRSTGQEVVDPDYLATWTIVKPAPQ